ncbi:CG16813 [Drosophila busckii]|uniref:CG16813 n=1 Tax=Drosophila busckii TaxID=30019 RepID=A0A0M4EAT3_DROBS|nr:CG16813 [Drosophila busckii]
MTMESSTIAADNYAQKKFSVLKRKRSQDDFEPELDVEFISEQPPAKRGFFRPWLDEPQPARKSNTNSNNNNPLNSITYHANMVRSQTPKQRSPKEQQRRDRNTLACLLSRRARQAKQLALEQQYQQFRQQHEANLQQQIRLSLYYVRFLQQAMASSSPLPPTPQQRQLQQIQQCWPQQAALMKR